MVKYISYAYLSVIYIMQNLRKIKKLQEEKAQKMYAMTQLMSKSKTNGKSDASFLMNTSQQKKQDQPRKVHANESPIFLVKDLDEGKIHVIDKDEPLQNMFGNLNQLPELNKIFDKIWEQYQTEREKQEELFLEACYQGNVEMVKKVVSSKSKHPIDPRAALTGQGKNGIHLATVSGSYKNTEIISVLATFNVDLNGRTYNQQRTPFMLGSILGNDIAVKALLQLNADRQLQDYQGNTALHLACIFNQQNIVEILLDSQCNIEVRNKKGLTPIQCIAKPQTYEMAKQKQPSLQYNQRTVVFDGQQPVAYRNSRKDDIQKLLKKIRESYDYTNGENQQEQQNEEAQKQQKKPKSRREHRQQKIKQVMIKQIKQIGLSSFKKQSLLGRGAFGEVYLVKNLQNNTRYAMKVLDKGMIMRQNILRYAMTERKILSTINHPFVVKLYYAFQSNQKLFLVMQYCPGGDLLKIIKKKGKLQQKKTKQYVAQVILAIEALHKAQIIYRDLKPGNIVMDEHGHACITDFGLSKQASLAHSFCGSTAYLAPEMIWRRGHTKVLDWYLLGVFIYECLTGKPPFWDTNRQKLLNNIKSGRFKHLGNQFSKSVQDLVQKLLKSNSSKRLGFHGAEQIKQHSWFSDIDWQKVQNRQLQMEEIEPLVGKPIRQHQFSEPSTIYDKVKGWDFNHS